MSRSKLLVGGLIVAVVALSASVAFAKPLTEQQFKKQGNAICKQVNADIDAAAKEAFAGLGDNDQPSEAQLESFVGTFVPAIEGALASIKELQAPSSLKANLTKFEAAVADALSKLDADPSLLADEKNDPFSKADKLAKKLGLKACS